MLSIKQISTSLVFVFALSTSSLVYAASFKVGFISNGAVQASRIESLIIEELSPLIKDSMSIEFVSFTAEPSPQSYQEQLELAGSDPEIRAIITPGFIGSQFLYSLDRFPKPTFLSWIVDPNLTGDEVKGNTPNLYWRSRRNDIENTFKSIVQVIGQKPVTLVADSATAHLDESFFDGIKKNAEKFGIEFSVTILDRSRPIIEQIAPGIALAVVTPMLEGSAEVIRQIQSGNIPVFTYEGSKVVKQGAMMTNLVDADESLIARSVALDIYGLLRGEKTEPGPRWLESEHHLTLNLETAKRMGVDLSVDVLS